MIDICEQYRYGVQNQPRVQNLHGGKNGSQSVREGGCVSSARLWHWCVRVLPSHRLARSTDRRRRQCITRYRWSQQPDQSGRTAQCSRRTTPHLQPRPYSECGYDQSASPDRIQYPQPGQSERPQARLYLLACRAKPG